MDQPKHNCLLIMQFEKYPGVKGYFYFYVYHEDGWIALMCNYVPSKGVFHNNEIVLTDNEISKFYKGTNLVDKSKKDIGGCKDFFKDSGNFVDEYAFYYFKDPSRTYDTKEDFIIKEEGITIFDENGAPHIANNPGSKVTIYVQKEICIKKAK